MEEEELMHVKLAKKMMQSVVLRRLRSPPLTPIATIQVRSPDVVVEPYHPTTTITMTKKKKKKNKDQQHNNACTQPANNAAPPALAAPSKLKPNPAPAKTAAQT
jgi:hypothetical protein